MSKFVGISTLAFSLSQAVECNNVSAEKRIKSSIWDLTQVSKGL